MIILHETYITKKPFIVQRISNRTRVFRLCVQDILTTKLSGCLNYIAMKLRFSCNFQRPLENIKQLDYASVIFLSIVTARIVHWTFSVFAVINMRPTVIGNNFDFWSCEHN